MGEITLRTFAYGLLAAASPVTFLATLVVLTSGRGRLNGAVFAASFLLGQSIAAVVGLFASAGAASRIEGHEDNAVNIFKLVVGVGLLIAARMGHRRRATHEPGTSARAEAVLARLERIRPATAVSAGLALGIGVKRLLITLLAMTSISTAVLSAGDEASLTLLYVAVASLCVWPAVVLYILFGARVNPRIDAAKRWLTANTASMTFYVTLVIGVFLCVDGLVGLV